MRAVVVGASSGLGRCISLGLAKRGAQVALLARRDERIEKAAAEAGNDSFALRCDVTDAASVTSALSAAAQTMGGIDAVVYCPGIGSISRIEEVTAEAWHEVFATNVVGASLVTAAALPHLLSSGGNVAYLSSMSASITSPWPGLAPYAVSKAALDKLIEAWTGEHPSVNFTRVIVGNCGGEMGTDGLSGFTDGWDLNLRAEFGAGWFAKGFVGIELVDVEDLINAVDTVLRSRAAVPSIAVVPRPKVSA